MSNNNVAEYYNQPVYGLEFAHGAGLIWYLSQDHLSPPASNEDKFALDAHKWRDATSERMVSMGERMGIIATDRVLDLGTGIGGPGRDMHNEFGCAVTGLNISIAQLMTLKKLSALQTSDYVNVVNGDIEELPFKDRTFDNVFSVNVLYHVGNYAKAIAEAARVLVPGGRFGLDDWFVTNRTSPSSLNRLRYNWSTPPDGFHGVEETIGLLDANELRIIDVVDFTSEAGEFLTEKRFGHTFDTQVAPTLVTVFPHLYQYEGYLPEHAQQAVSQLRSDVLYMGELYRNREAAYLQFIAEKDSA